jgi:hypothetical protein
MNHFHQRVLEPDFLAIANFRKNLAKDKCSRLVFRILHPEILLLTPPSLNGERLY